MLFNLLTNLIYGNREYAVPNNDEQVKTIKLIAMTSLCSFVVIRCWDWRKHLASPNIAKFLEQQMFFYARKIPYFRQKLDDQLELTTDFLFKDLKKRDSTNKTQDNIIISLPKYGLDSAEILEKFNKFFYHYKHGKMSGGVYASYDAEKMDLMSCLWSKTCLTNPLHAEWPLLMQLELETIAMCQNLFNGDINAPGLLTHGGTTSILEAMKAYVLAARERDNIDRPEVIIPETAHAAFYKAEEILNIELLIAPVDINTRKVDLLWVKNHINKNTILLVGSAPNFPDGIIDPIEELGILASSHNIGLHIDACLGGFLLPFTKAAGFNDIPVVDFSIPGVTSISADTHKYGGAPKGNSVILFKNNYYGKYLGHAYLDLPMGMYATFGIDGSRSGADIAVTWATLTSNGQEYYINMASKILSLQRNLIANIANKFSPDIEIIGAPLLSIVGFKSNNINMHLVAENLYDNKWSVNILQNPDGFHFCLTAVHCLNKNFIIEFTDALAIAIEYAKQNATKKPGNLLKSYGMLKTKVPEYIKKELGREYLRVSRALPV